MEKESERQVLAHAASDRIQRVMRMHHRIVERRIEGAGIHHSQHRMLLRLSRMGSAPTQKDIAAALDVSQACVARALKGLVAGGLIEKRNGEDNRCNQIDILPEGQRVIDESLKTFRQIDAEMFRGIPDQDIDRLTAILDRVHENLSAMERDGASKGVNAP